MLRHDTVKIAVYRSSSTLDGRKRSSVATNAGICGGTHTSVKLSEKQRMISSVQLAERCSTPMAIDIGSIADTSATSRHVLGNDLSHVLNKVTYQSDHK